MHQRNVSRMYTKTKGLCVGLSVCANLYFVDICEDHFESFPSLPSFNKAKSVINIDRYNNGLTPTLPPPPPLQIVILAV